MSIMGNIRICQIDFYKSGYHELTDYEDIVNRRPILGLAILSAKSRPKAASPLYCSIFPSLPTDLTSLLPAACLHLKTLRILKTLRV